MGGTGLALEQGLHATTVTDHKASSSRSESNVTLMAALKAAGLPADARLGSEF